MDGLVQAELFGLPLPILMAGGGVSVAVLMIGLIITSMLSSGKRNKQLNETFAKRGLVKSTIAKSSTSAGVRRKEESTTGVAVVDETIKRITPKPELMARRLERTGRNIQLGRYVAFCLILIVVFTALIMMLSGLSLPTASLIGILLGVGLPHMVIGMMIKSRYAKFLSLFPDAIDLIVRGLRSGLPVTESIRTVSTEIGNPVGGEFGRIADALALGKTLEEAMWECAGRLDIPEFRFFVISISVQRETGGNLAETLENLADVLRKRRQTKLKIKALSSEAKASALIIGSLPFIMFGILFFVNQGYVMFLIDDPRGNILLGIGLFWLFVGFAAMAKMVRFEI
ncbi:MAG: type II secretion system F family protein [Pseudomonadota bacterium]